jgi:hypothetical protein
MGLPAAGIRPIYPVIFVDALVIKIREPSKRSTDSQASPVSLRRHVTPAGSAATTIALVVSTGA